MNNVSKNGDNFGSENRSNFFRRKFDKPPKYLFTAVPLVGVMIEYMETCTKGSV